MNKENKESFSYTYSANEQEEIKAIRKKYIAPEKTEDKMTQLRQLDLSVMQKATAVSLVLGIVGALILGFGMSLIMTELGTFMGLGENTALLIGIVAGVPGIALMCCAYPVYNRTVVRERERIAPEILRLTEELLK